MNPVMFFMFMGSRWWNPFFWGQSQGQKREKQGVAVLTTLSTPSSTACAACSHRR